MEIRGRNYENGEPIAVTIDGERIVDVRPAMPEGAASELPWIAPGLFDLQINGNGGTWFGRVGITADEVLQALEPHFRFGVTRLCPTLITNSREALADGFAAVREACEREPWAAKLVAGCHLEGPYISGEDGPRGAHPLEHVRDPDWSEFEALQEASGGRIVLVTLAPERRGASEFIAKAVKSGVTIAIGHTAANSDEITAAVDAGARLSTHLGNGAHGMIRRHPNYIWDQLGEPRLTASLITDGHHLPPSVMRSIIFAKTPRNIVITCDASGLAGCPPGLYREGSIEMEILEDGRIVLAGQRQLLAGSTLETDGCITACLVHTDVTLPEAIDMAGRNPARLLRREEIGLFRGSRADVILFTYSGKTDRLKVRTTIAAGVVRHGTVPASGFRGT
ncbi:MAG: N-acetylglucosamine-6-phosphate deacetylase [Planctomycetaceae bacterium]